MSSTINASTASGGGVITTADASGILQLQTAGVTALTIDGSQNVGIGTSSPDSVLSVYAANKTIPAISARYSAAGFKAGFSVYNVNGYPYLSFNVNPVTSSNSGTYDITGVASKIDFASSASSADIIFSNAISGTAGTAISWLERMRIDASGNVGIGTSSPTQRLTVIGSGQCIYFGSATRGIMSQDSGGRTQFYAVDPAVTAFHPLTIDALNTVFATSTIERMRIDSSGNLLVGTTSQFGSGKVCVSYDGTVYNGVALRTTNAALNSNFVTFYNSATTNCGGISQNGTTTVNYITSSDYRLKENIAPMIGALDKVVNLNPVTYIWKDTNNEVGEGFIAHELQAICPLAVSGEKDAVNEDGSIKAQGIDPSKLVATLTAAIKELKAIIDTQNARIEALEAK